ncbi:MAG: septum formation initiator family protein [Desulfobacterales bacterium]
MARKNRRSESAPRLTGIWMVLLAVFIAELLFYTWCRVQYVRTGYELAEQTQRSQRLAALQNQLKIELAHLKNPKRIAEIARRRLGLSMPSAGQTIVLP